VAPEGLSAEFRKVHQFNAFSCNTPVQVALASFLQDREAYLGLSALMQSKRDYFVRGMASSRFSLKPSHGSYFICGTYERISDEADKDFAIRLTREAGVATIPVSAFYQEGTDHKVLRFCFSKKEDTLDRALEKLCKL
jgi:methionine aminotransferase